MRSKRHNGSPYQGDGEGGAFGGPEHLDLTHEPVQATARADARSPDGFFIDADFQARQIARGRVRFLGASGNTPLIYLVALPLASLFAILAAMCLLWGRPPLSGVIAIGLLALSLLSGTGAFVLAMRAQQPSSASTHFLEHTTTTNRSEDAAVPGRTKVALGGQTDDYPLGRSTSLNTFERGGTQRPPARPGSSTAPDDPDQA